MTKTIALILVAVLVVGGGVTAGVVIGNNNLPENVVAEALLSLADFAERRELKPIYEVLTNGSIEMSQSYIRQNGKTEMWTNTAKVYFANDGVVLQNINFAQTGFELQGEVWLTEDFVCINAENLLDSAYALEFGNLTKQFEKSIFAYGSNSEYAIQDQRIYANVLSLLGDIDKLNARKMQKELTQIGQSYLKELWDIACKQVDFSEGTKAMEIDGKKVDVRNIQIVVDGYDVCKIWEATLDFLQEDEQVTKFLDKNEDLLNIANNPVFGAEQSTDQTMADMYRMLLKQLRNNFYPTAAEIQESWGDDELIIDVTTPKHNAQLLKLNVNYANQDVYTLDFAGKTIKDTNKITLIEQGVKQVYQTLNGDQIFRMAYSVDGVEVFKFQLDKETSNYELYYDATINDDISPISYRIEGKVIDGADLKITINKVTQIEDNIWWENPMETSYLMDLAFVLKDKDKLPAKPQDYKTLETLTEEDLEKLLSFDMQLPEHN